MQGNWLFGLTIIALTISCSSCNSDENIYDSSGVVISRPYLWKASITDNPTKLAWCVGIPIIYKEENVVVPASKDNHGAVMSFNAFTGEVNWQWADVMRLITKPQYFQLIYLDKPNCYINNNLLFFTCNGASYCIDMVTGNTAWKVRLPDIGRFDKNGGIDNTYFTSGSDYDIDDPDRIYTGSLLSADVEQLLLIPNYTFLPKIVDPGRINDIECFKKDGINYIAFSIENPAQEFTPAGWGLTELNLYNLAENKYVYKKVAINPNKDTRAAGDITYQEPNLYFQSSKYIHSYNAMTGVENWRTYLGAAPLTSHMLLADNKLFSACEDENFLFCLDATSGNILWKIRNTGTCSSISYLNGILYFLGGGDGYLHAVEAASGKRLWKIKSPDESINSNAFFNGSVNAVSGKNGGRGVVVATSGLNAYAYEAAR